MCIRDRALAALVRAAKKLAPAGVQRTEVLADIQRNRAAFKATCQEGATSDAWPMRPERILADVRAVLPRDAIITTDVGWNKNGLAQQMDILTPGSVFTPGGFATMGFGEMCIRDRFADRRAAAADARCRADRHPGNGRRG